MSNIERTYGLLKDDRAQALVGGAISMCLLSLVLLVVGIMLFMITKRTDVILAARHAAWLDAMHYSAPDSAGIRAHVNEVFFNDPDLFQAGAPQFENAEGPADTGISQVVTYEARYGHDPFDPGADPDSLPGVLVLFRVRLPLVGQQDAVMGDPLDDAALGRKIGFVDASCSWDRVGNTWPCPGDLFDGLFDLVGSVVSQLSPL